MIMDIINEGTFSVGSLAQLRHRFNGGHIGDITDLQLLGLTRGKFWVDIGIGRFSKAATNMGQIFGLRVCIAEEEGGDDIWDPQSCT